MIVFDSKNGILETRISDVFAVRIGLSTANYIGWNFSRFFSFSILHQNFHLSRYLFHLFCCHLFFFSMELFPNSQRLWFSWLSCKFPFNEWNTENVWKMVNLIYLARFILQQSVQWLTLLSMLNQQTMPYWLAVTMLWVEDSSLFVLPSDCSIKLHCENAEEKFMLFSYANASRSFLEIKAVRVCKSHVWCRQAAVQGKILINRFSTESR